MSFLDGLNDRQREAVDTLEGALLIVAGAGSGKTRTLTYRIVNLLLSSIAKPWEILAITFTNKAAKEMKDRIYKLLAENFDSQNIASSLTIGTFHSVCLNILRFNFDHFKRDSNFVIYDTVDQESLIKRIIKEEDIDKDMFKARSVLSAISKAKNKLLNPLQFKSYASNYFQEIVAKIYLKYEERLINNNALDFDDILLYTLRLFKENKKVLTYYQDRWKFISVDEYQDTNYVQYLLVKLLANKYKNICVIGDGDQSIYAFRGADLNNILDFEKDYKNAKLIKLEQNYRSSQNILNASDAVISKNKNRKSKNMWTDAGDGDLIGVFSCKNEYDEGDNIAKEIDRLRSKNIALKDMVVLYRTNTQSRVLEETFLKYAIPYKVVGGLKFYARKEIKDILAYLRLIINFNDVDSLLRIINIPSRKIGKTTINKLQAFAMSRSLNLSELLKHIEMVSEINESLKTKLLDFSKLFIKWKDLSKKKHVDDLIKEIIKDIKYKEYLLDGSEEGSMRYDNILELISVASKYSNLEEDLSLTSFLEEVALISDLDSVSEENDLVTMMTVHSVKGLEYKYVFISACEDNIFPHIRSLSNEFDIEEERRLMYVAMTRAMKKLYLSFAKQRSTFGNFQRNDISRFLKDIPENLLSSPLSKISKIINFNNFIIKENKVIEDSVLTETAQEMYKDGDRIKHNVFGEGIVVERRGDLLTIAFKNPLYGVKKIASNIAKIEKL